MPLRKGNINRGLVLPLVIAVTLSLSVLASVHAYASPYESQQGVKETFSIAGVQGTLTTTSPYVSTLPVDLNHNHRDYMVYVNFFTSSSAMGAGWSAIKASSGGIIRYDLIYTRTPTLGTGHSWFNTIPDATSFTAYVEQQTSSSSNCWKGGTYSNTLSMCFPTGSHPAGMAGSMARSVEKDYASGVDDMPGKFNYLQAGKWSGSIVSYTYFSNPTYLNEYKCYSSDKSTTVSFVLDKLTSYAGGSPIDRVGSGPRTYTIDDCGDSQDNQSWTAIGSN